MARETSSKQDKLKTPSSGWETFDDARSKKGAMQYGTHDTRKLRDGGVWINDSTKDHEHITIQHRSGSMIQFLPDGAVQYVTHNGQHNTIFGEHRSRVTGAQDMTVEGDSSLKTYGDRNDTTEGGKYTSVGGDRVEVAQSFNGAYAKQFDVGAESASHTTKADLSFTAGGHGSFKSAGGMAVGSEVSGLQLHGRTGVGIKGSTNSTIEANLQTSIMGKTCAIDGTGGVFINCGVSLPIATAVQMPNPSSITGAGTPPTSYAGIGNLVMGKGPNG